MATYRLTGPDGSQYQVTAPDEASQDEVLQHFKEHFNQQQPQQEGPPPLSPEEKEVAERPMGAMERYGRLATSYVPGSNQVRAATYATVPGAMDPSLDDPSWWERYKHARNVGYAKDAKANETEDPIGNTLARTAGLTASAIGTGGYSLFNSALPAGATLPQILKESARIGGGMAAPISYLNSQSTDPLEETKDVAQGTLGGMAMGMAFPLGLAGVGRVGRALRPSDASRAAARGVQQDFTDAGVPTLGPALSDSATINSTARGLTGSVVGGPLREQAQASEAAIQRRLQEAITGGAGAPSPGDFGQDSQDFLRRTLLEHSTPGETLDNMSPQELERAAQGQGGESYPTMFGARYRQAENEPVEGYGAASNIRGNFLDPQVGPRTPAQAEVPWNPDEIESIAQQWKFAKDTEKAFPPETLTNYVIRSGGLKDYGREVQQVVGSYKERPGLVSNKGNTLDDMARKAWEDGFFPGTERPSIPEFLEALQDDLHNRSVVRPVDQPKLDDQHTARQMAEELHGIGVWDAKSQDEVRQRLTDNPKQAGVPSRMVPEGPTATYSLLNTLGQEARARGQLVGWKDNDLNSPQLWRMLRGHFGQEVTDTLQSEYNRRQSNQANLTLPGLRDQRTLVRRVLQDEANPQPVNPREVRNVANLQRLHGAMSQDLQTFLNNAGATRAADRYRATDTNYRSFVEDMREPLRRVFGDNVAPDEAYRRLLRATQNRTQDIRLLRAYYDAVGNKGAPGQTTQATRALLGHMLEGGLPGFVENWRNVSPDARRIMFQRDAFVGLAPALDRLANVAQRVAPYAQAAQRASNGLNLHSTHNLALAGAMFWHLPAAIQAAGGAHLLSRAMASPRFVNWLTQIPQRGQLGVRSPQFAAHVAKGTALGLPDQAAGQAITQAITSMIPGASAAQLPQKPETESPVAKTVFGGPKSKTADLKALEQAKDMDTKGSDPGETWSKTGWMKNKAGEWMHEIDDSKAKTSIPKFSEDELQTTLGQLLHHPDLYKAYPHLRDFPVNVNNLEEPENGIAATHFDEDGGKALEMDISTKQSKQEFRNSLLHEVGHILDGEEGRDYGPYEGRYDQRIGEVRSRNIEARSRMDKATRRATYPGKTEDIPEILQNTSRNGPGRFSRNLIGP